jgi:hypothetical protein
VKLSLDRCPKAVPEFLLDRRDSEHPAIGRSIEAVPAITTT